MNISPFLSPFYIQYSKYENKKGWSVIFPKNGGNGLFIRQYSHYIFSWKELDSAREYARVFGGNSSIHT